MDYSKAIEKEIGDDNNKVHTKLRRFRGLGIDIIDCFNIAMTPN